MERARTLTTQTDERYLDSLLAFRIFWHKLFMKLLITGLCSDGLMDEVIASIHWYFNTQQTNYFGSFFPLTGHCKMAVALLTSFRLFPNIDKQIILSDITHWKVRA